MPSDLENPTTAPFPHQRFGPGDEKIFAEHLLEGCEQCLLQAAELHHASRRPVLEDQEPFEAYDYGDAVQNAIRTSLTALGEQGKWRGEAPKLLEELWRFPEERRQIVICNRSRFHHFGLSELLLSRSKDLWFTSPDRARKEAELAVAVAEILDHDAHDFQVVSDLRGRAWAYLGNANRILSDFRTAEANFRNAAEHLEKGTGSPEVSSLLGEFRIALFLAQRRFEEADGIAAEVARTYRRIGDTHLLGRILIRQGTSRVQQEAWTDGARLLRQGLRLVDAQRDSRLHLTGRYNLLFCLMEEGDLAQARGMLNEVRAGLTELGDPLSLVRLRWLEGKLSLKEGDLATAEMHLNEARQRFLDEGIGYDTALVGMDLAKIYAEQGRTRELKLLAAATVPIFQARDVHEEALAALVLFHQAAEAEAVTLSLLGRLSDFLEKVQTEPDLKFHQEG